MSSVQLVQSERYAIAERIAFFLVEKGLRVGGQWVGHLKKSDQLKHFGFYLGRGELVVDGTLDTIEVTKTICFGAEREVIGGIDMFNGCAHYASDTKHQRTIGAAFITVLGA